MRTAALLIAIFAASASAFYLPGVSPHAYTPNEDVKLFVNSLTSVKTHLPYDFYDLAFCRPPQIRDVPENLGQLLLGSEIQNSAFMIKMDSPEDCKVLCRIDLNPDQRSAFVDAVEDEYVVNWIVDNLPAAVQVHIPDTDASYKVYEHGFYVGGVEESNVFINNHYNIKILVHSGEDFQGKRIVGFEVEALSVDHLRGGATFDKENPPTHLEAGTCNTEAIVNRQLPAMVVSGPALGDVTDEVPVVYTYSVRFEPSNVRWASRWDIYLSMNNRYSDEVHWFSIGNSVAIVLFLTGMVALIMTRTIYKDLRRYNRVPTDEELEEEREETGWKLVHADVFRPPHEHPMILSAAVGTGLQMVSMAFFLLIFAAAGFLSPANRGSLMIALLLQFVLMGVVAGYVSARTYKLFYGTSWQRCTVLTAMGFPGAAFGIFFVLNLFVWHVGSSGAVPFGSMFALMLLWFGISVPLVFLGAFYGYKKDRVALPTATSAIPRQIPPQPWYLQPTFTILVGGILPFSAVFVELYFILTSIWLDQYYYVFGFLMLVFLILILTCVELSIVLTYFQLCAEDYRWAWRSFLTPGSSAIYLFLYSVFYYSTKLDMTAFIPSLLYFGYMFLVSVGFFLLTGAIGFVAALVFNIRIFGSIKVD